MRGGLVGSLCFLAFLLSSGTKGQNVHSQDLQDKVNSIERQQKLNENKLTLQGTQNGNADNRLIRDEKVHGDTSKVVGSADSASAKQGNLVKTNLFFPPNSESNTNAQALGGTNPGYGYPNSNSANAHSDANNVAKTDSASSYGNQGLTSGEVHNVYDNKEVANAVKDTSNKDTSDREDRVGGGYFDNGPFYGAVSRVVSQNEIINPELMPGGQNLIMCTRENELHTIWSPMLQCLVCVCIRDGWSFRPVCVTCSTCMKKPEPQPLMPPIPFTPPLLPSIPDSQVSCSPLPTNTPFENPLNPCQTCICKTFINSFGQEDSQIKCEENPNCVSPPGFIPQLPTQVPQLPMAICEKLPPNVPFPHPTQSCLICRCVVEMTNYLYPDKRMTCQPDPRCDPLRENIITPQVPDFPIIPYPTPTPSTPLPSTIPSTEIDPVPWPPVQPNVQPPSPLPGPPPHDTCKPYPPNTPFQHPWDECQICVCSEIYGRNVVNIEVSCYTKKSCCVEPPIPEPVPALPYNGPSSYGNVIFIEPKCRYKAPNQPYVVDCDICVCETAYQYVYAKCTPQPNCGQPPVYGQLGLIPGSITNANAAANAQASGTWTSTADAISNAMSGGLNNQGQASSSAIANAFANTGNQYPFGVGSPSSSYSTADAWANAQTGNINVSPYMDSYPYSLGGQSSAQAQAEALANAQSGNANLSPYSNLYPYSLGGQSSAQAQAEALANAQSGNANLSPYSNLYPYSLGGQSSTQAQAEALTNAQSGNVNLSPYSNLYPYSLGGQSSAQAQAEALANAQSGNVNLSPYSNLYPYASGGQSSAQAEALANAQSGNANLSPYSNLYPYSLGGQSSAQAQAEALANAQAGNGNISPYSNLYPYSSGGQSSAQAQSEALAQSSNLSPFGINIYGQGDQSSAQAQADALAQSGSLSLYGGSYGGLYPFGQGQSSSQAEALANAQNLGSLGSTPYGNSPYNPFGYSSAQSQSEALANAQSQSLGSPYGANLGGSQASAQAQSEAISASQLYPSMYNQYPTSNQPGVNGWDNFGQSQSMASAQAQAQAQQIDSSVPTSFGGSSGSSQSQAMAQGSATAQSLAQAAAISGRPLIKSGKGLCKYSGDKYHHNCQACYCLAEASGKIYTLCLGNPCA